jgi:uncharacterized membrane protein YfcA
MAIIGLGLIGIMGTVLGLLGGGGSILTVPILVYLFDIPAALATGYSLFIVGITSIIGAIRYRHHVRLLIGLVFAVPASMGVTLSRRYLLQPLPDTLIWGQLTIPKDDLIMIIFAILMIGVGWAMFRKRLNDTRPPIGMSLTAILLIGVEGLIVGGFTGFVGAGGGFMIVPALTLLAGIPLRDAIATSLLVIAAKSLIGFAGDIQMGIAIDWTQLLVFTSLTIAGSFMGVALNKRVSVTHLRHVFAGFVCVFGLGILLFQLNDFL